MENKKHKHEYIPVALFNDIYTDDGKPFVIQACDCGNHQVEWGNKIN